MVCKSCNSSNVAIEIIQSGGNVKKRSKGIDDYLLNFFRIISRDLYSWNCVFVLEKKRRKNKIEFRSIKTCVCHDCRYSWELKQ